MFYGLRQASVIPVQSGFPVDTFVRGKTLLPSGSSLLLSRVLISTLTGLWNDFYISVNGLLALILHWMHRETKVQRGVSSSPFLKHNELIIGADRWETRLKNVLSGDRHL